MESIEETGLIWNKSMILGVIWSLLTQYEISVSFDPCSSELSIWLSYRLRWALTMWSDLQILTKNDRLTKKIFNFGFQAFGVLLLILVLYVILCIFSSVLTVTDDFHSLYSCPPFCGVCEVRGWSWQLFCLIDLLKLWFRYKLVFFWYWLLLFLLLNVS